MQLDLTAIVKGGEPFAQVLRRNTHHWAAMAIEVSDRNETVHVVLVPHQHPLADSAIGAADNHRNRPEQIFHRLRSEERRVGKECRSRWRPYQLKKKRRKECSAPYSETSE